jgi:hypothetical protein
MSLHDHSEHHDQPRGNFLTSRMGLVLVGFLVIAGVLLFTEHRAHVLGALIWLPLLICPLMHMFGHGGHGGHGGPTGQDQTRRDRSVS